MIRDEIPPGRKFRDVEDIQREVIDKLNAVTKKVGLPDYFTHNGLDKPKYLSVVCTGCKHCNYLWFNKIESADGKTQLSYKYPPYGINLHNDLKRHLPENIKAKAAQKGIKTKAKRM